MKFLLFALLISVCNAGIKLDLKWNQRAFVTELYLGLPRMRCPLEVTSLYETLYVFGAVCEKCSVPYSSFNISQSVTYKSQQRAFEDAHEDGKVYGTVGRDQLLFPSGPVVPSQDVAVIHYQKQKLIPSKLFASGVLGLGPSDPMNTQISLKPTYKTLGGAQITYRIFHSNDTTAEDTGIIYLGHIEARGCQTSNVHHRLLLNWVQANGIYLNAKPIYGMISVQFSVSDEKWRFPRSLLEVIKKEFKVYNDIGQILCTASYPEIRINIDSESYSLRGQTDKDFCYLNAVATEDSKITVGKSFFYEYCVSYDLDNKQVTISKTQ